ncbi:MAG: hypothetical protein QM498_05400 [Desulfobacterium sp.]
MKCLGLRFIVFLALCIMVSGCTGITIIQYSTNITKPQPILSQPCHLGEAAEEAKEVEQGKACKQEEDVETTEEVDEHTTGADKYDAIIDLPPPLSIGLTISTENQDGGS